LGLTVTSEELELIKKHPNIENVDVDNEIFAFEKNLREEPGVDGREFIPYGIRRVLQDVDFWNDKIGDIKGAIKVCVADTGFDRSHEDLPKDYVDGIDAYGEHWYEDGNSHGTHTSGTVAAVRDNGKGVVGVIPDEKNGNFELLIGKALGASGAGTGSGVLAAVQGCIDQGANVVSMSLGCNSCYTNIENDFYKEKYEDGILIVAAAGNSGNTIYSYPASYDSVISVAAVDRRNNVAYFSQYNDQVEIAAPGVDVYSTVPDNKYAFYSGTSMATPHVAAVLGLVWMYFPECSNAEMRKALAESAKSLGEGECNEYYGNGLVQAKDFYDTLSRTVCTGTILPIQAGCNVVSFDADVARMSVM